MRLIVCYTTAATRGHPCGVAYHALKAAGHAPDVQKGFGWNVLPDALNVSSGRKEAKRRTGKVDLPVLILDDDSTVAGSREIVEWAAARAKR
jgi:hypothetical protein